MPDPLAAISTRSTPQTERAHPAQVPNSAGGHVFALDDMARLRRFLVLGTTGGTYYARERELTAENAAVALELARTRGVEVVAEVVAVSAAGRAPRPHPALFTLAAVSGLGDDAARRAAADALPLVARTGTHLFLFAGYAEQFRGWGRGLRRAVGAWYTGKSADALAHQVVKYRRREGWSHRDLLRLAHPQPADDAQRAVLDLAAGRDGADSAAHPAAPALLEGFRRAQRADSPAVTARLVREHGPSWEMLRSEHLADAGVWEALLETGLPQTALLRSLPRLTGLGLLRPGSPHLAAVTAQLTDPERLRRARVHPVSVLVALRTYASGRSVRGEGTWEPVGAVTDALDAAFPAAFGAVEPTGGRLLLALDVSGSMVSRVSGLPLSCREASAALAVVSAAVERDPVVLGFTAAGWAPSQRVTSSWRRGRTLGTDGLTALDVSRRRRLDDVVRSVTGLPFGRTDCALPMQFALAERLEVDTFVVYTDNETYAGSQHPHQALAAYRQGTGIDAELVVVAMTSTGSTIADPSDPGMLDVAGFDAAVPSLVSDFARGALAA